MTAEELESGLPWITRVGMICRTVNGTCKVAERWTNIDMFIVSDRLRQAPQSMAAWYKATIASAKVVAAGGFKCTCGGVAPETARAILGVQAVAAWVAKSPQLAAAKAGAKKVIACEFTEMANHARRLVAANGLENVVDVRRSAVEALDLEKGSVDIIISEWMGYFLLRE